MRRTPALIALLFAAVACGASSSSSPSAGADDAGSDAATEVGADECTPKGPLYQCHTYDRCNAGYMPLQGISCGSPTRFCCLKGALPPEQEAGADASNDADSGL